MAPCPAIEIFKRAGDLEFLGRGFRLLLGGAGDASAPDST